jgi:hypothetical protein
MWTKAKVDDRAVISGAAPYVGFAFRPDSALGPARLYAKGTAGAPLAGATVTDSHADRLSLNNNAKLPAGTCGGTCGCFPHASHL